MELKFFIPGKTTWGQIKGTREVHQEKTWDRIKTVQALHSPYILSANLTLNCCYKPGKAAKLFFSTSPKTLPARFDSAPVHRGWGFDIIIRHLHSISCYTSMLESEILLKQGQEYLYDVIINLEKMFFICIIIFFRTFFFFTEAFKGYVLHSMPKYCELWANGLWMIF